MLLDVGKAIEKGPPVNGIKKQKLIYEIAGFCAPQSDMFKCECELRLQKNT